MTMPKESSQINSAFPDRTIDGLAKYCAALERKLVHLTLKDVRMRTVCEIATGAAYDSFDPSDMTFEQLQEQVAHDMARGLKMSIQEARELVEKLPVGESESIEISTHAGAIFTERMM